MTETIDQNFVTLAMLAIMLDKNPDILTREELADFLRSQFDTIDFTAPLEVLVEAASSPQFSDGFRALGCVAYMTLGTNAPREYIVNAIRATFDSPEARELPEYQEALRHFEAAVAQ